MNTLTVVVPFYNEELTLYESVDRLKAISCVNQIYLVNDGSRDKSRDIALKLQNESKKIKYFEKNTNEGKGSCLNYVIDKISTTHLIMHDADLEYNPNSIVKLFHLVEKHPKSLIAGSRVLNQNNNINKYSHLAFGVKILSYLLSKLYSVSITDIATGYLLLPASFVKNIQIEEKGFGIEVELISKFLKMSNDILELPIEYSSRSYKEGKKIKIVDGLNIFFKIFKFRIIT